MASRKDREHGSKGWGLEEKELAELDNRMIQTLWRVCDIVSPKYELASHRCVSKEGVSPGQLCDRLSTADPYIIG